VAAVADDDKAKDPGKDAKDDDKGGQGDGGGGLEATVRRVVAELLPRGRGGGAAAEHDVTAQVEAAVTRVHNGQQAAQVIKDLETRLKAVEEKKIPEKKPREYRSITKRIWGHDDDE
jgi:hypothetical protein